MTTAVNTSQATSWLSDYLALQNKPASVYNSNNTEVERAAQAVINSVGQAGQTVEKLYNPNVSQEISSIITISEQARSGTLPDSTNNTSYLSGDFLLSHKFIESQNTDELDANKDPWGVYIENRNADGYLYHQSIDLSRTPLNFVRDDEKSLSIIQAEYEAGTVSKSFSQSKYMITGYMSNIPDKQYFIVQQNGYFTNNLTATDEEASAGVQKALEFRTEYNIYVKYGDYYTPGAGDINYQKRTITTKYRFGLDSTGDIKTSVLTEQTLSRNYSEGTSNYSVSIDTRQTSITAAQNYNMIKTTVSSDQIGYKTLSKPNLNNPQGLVFSSTREVDTIIQPTSPESTVSASTQHYYSSRGMNLTQNFQTPEDSSFRILDARIEEGTITSSVSNTGALSASDSFIGVTVSNITRDEFSNAGPVTITASSENRSLSYNPITGTGSYKVSGGGVRSAGSPVQLEITAGTPSTANVARSFKKSDIPTLSTVVNDPRLVGSADSSTIHLNVNDQNTSFYKKHTARDTNINLDLTNNTSTIETSYGGWKMRNRLKLKTGQPNPASTGNQSYGTVATNIPNNQYAPNTPNNNYESKPTYYDHINTETGEQYGLFTNNGMGPFHIVGNQIYGYRKNSSNSQKYFKITV